MSEIIDEEDISIYYLDSEHKSNKLDEFRDKYNIEYVPSLIYFNSESYKDIDLYSLNKEDLKVLFASFDLR